MENSLCRRRKEEVAEPEVDPERDQRTVFAYQVALLNKSFTMLLFLTSHLKLTSFENTIAVIFEGR
jgi:uncharacterized protein affecting Mg2+/Co2+ transport